jgi:hypothetical protein
MIAAAIHSQLEELHAERALARLTGLAANAAYMADLEEEITTTTRDYVTAAVAEIARLGADISGPQFG